MYYIMIFSWYMSDINSYLSSMLMIITSVCDSRFIPLWQVGNQTAETRQQRHGDKYIVVSSYPSCHNVMWWRRRLRYKYIYILYVSIKIYSKLSLVIAVLTTFNLTYS